MQMQSSSITFATVKTIFIFLKPHQIKCYDEIAFSITLWDLLFHWLNYLEFFIS